MEYWQILIIILVIFIIRFLLYFTKYLFLKKAEFNYKLFRKATLEDVHNREISEGQIAVDWINENSVEIKKLILRTEFKNPHQEIMHDIGGVIKLMKIDVLDNLVWSNDKVQEWVKDLIQQAKGHIVDKPT